MGKLDETKMGRSWRAPTYSCPSMPLVASSIVALGWRSHVIFVGDLHLG